MSCSCVVVAAIHTNSKAEEHLQYSLYGNSLNNAFNLVIGVHLCCINGQVVTHATLSSDSDAGVRWNLKQTKNYLTW